MYFPTFYANESKAVFACVNIIEVSTLVETEGIIIRLGGEIRGWGRRRVDSTRKKHSGARLSIVSPLTIE